MKILHRFWQSRFFNLLLIPTLLWGPPAWGQISGQGVPGLLSSLENEISLNRQQYQQMAGGVSAGEIVSLEGVTALSLTAKFINTLVLFSPPQYIHLIGDNECTFFSLLEHGLLFSLEQTPELFPVIWDSEKEKGKEGAINRRLFFDYIYSKRCFSNKEISTIFSPSTIATTVNRLSLPTPKAEKECDAIFKNWYTNPYTPALCKIPEIINNSIKYQEKLSSLDKKNKAQALYYSNYIKQGQQLVENIAIHKRSYIENLCNNLDHPERFCSFYLSDDVWARVVKGGLPRNIMEYSCREIFKKEKTSDEELNLCRTKMLQDDLLCSTVGSSLFPALTPAPRCSDLSRALNSSSLNADYRDCPGHLDNDAVANISRIIRYFKATKNDSTPESCEGEMQSTFATLIVGEKNNPDESEWPMKICYPNPVTRENVCRTYIPGNDATSLFSEVSVITDILHKIRGADPKNKCQYVSFKKYRPLLLDFRHGCFIVFDQEKCTSMHCNKKIFYNQKEMSEIKYSGRHNLEYLASTYMNSSKSLIKMIERPLKVENRSLKNLTEVTFFLDQFKKRLVHGIGCLEDLLPAFYKKNSLNQCRPIPFIIDGYFIEENNSYMVVRTSIDDVHAPRPILWSYIYNAIANYKSIHPVSMWPLYGVKSK
ncbi:MAG: hypothetical protein A2504_06620 [Bdellovibrionales bacterium RIFOXYD12_FULL_39_22]|nr:MAG: hypothetical protein A2385_08940 [Bdellovibrionales bacterium RIFOXYB1_FULL_39_21]OFZ45174.1 MAG: hypothetical protein A2485_05595 [Bdellovibrionales bacterium RIFOXYC12_FULL_39_17]OFZ45634.1 MAG: hypothetical protein A2404_03520 [Bdellovibrionales bacterium RIFOXYC1_FULL_39_130]OFZ74174.1 MAG: hypothetical protein A2451_05890 [Bdellovibrionales bacterium RIFOXYC2_FULL_39_8]OFZ77496.1 MAG: hypothetical protein A2560_09110 [Bdellovibrionales bacterium RIFOXYD1_FULL_39_84]OFZ91625.1 MAG: